MSATRVGPWGGEIDDELWRMRWQDQRWGLARLVARIGKWGGEIGGEDWRVILSNFLEQGGEGRDREWQREKKWDRVDGERDICRRGERKMQ